MTNYIRIIIHVYIKNHKVMKAIIATIKTEKFNKLAPLGAAGSPPAQVI